jgi:hypothetical protein
MAALYGLQGIMSFTIHAAAQVDSEGRAVYAADGLTQQSFVTGIGTGANSMDMLFNRRLNFTASQAAADSIDLQSLLKAGNTQVMSKPKYLIVQYLEGEGTAYFDRGATDGYTGISADGHSVSKLRPLLVLPLTVASGASDKDIATSETAGATVSVQVTILGSSA